MKRILIIAGVGIVFFYSCSKGNGGGGGGSSIDCSTVTNKAFNADVLPIFSGVCAAAGCHASGSTNGPGALTNFAQISANKTAIRTAVSNGTMPQNSTLSTSQKASIICWIDSGAPNN